MLDHRKTNREASLWLVHGSGCDLVTPAVARTGKWPKQRCWERWWLTQNYQLRAAQRTARELLFCTVFNPRISLKFHIILKTQTFESVWIWSWALGRGFVAKAEDRKGQNWESHNSFAEEWDPLLSSSRRPRFKSLSHQMFELTFFISYKNVPVHKNILTQVWFDLCFLGLSCFARKSNRDWTTDWKK